MVASAAGVGQEIGVNFNQFSMVSGQWYSFGLDFLDTVPGRDIRIALRDSAYSILLSKEFKSNTYWKRYTFTYYATSNYANARLSIAFLDSTGVLDENPFYIDGVQIENKAYPTTYFDGESKGYLAGQTAYFWNGARAASTSTRIAATGSGGKEVSIRDLGFSLLGVLGLGMIPFNAANTALSNGGALYQKSIPQTREFTLVGAFEGESYAEIDRKRKELLAIIGPERLSLHQPILLKYHRINRRTGEDTETIEIPCVYENGLEKTMDNPNQERVAIVFRQFIPSLFSDYDSSAVLGLSLSVSNANGIIKQDSTGLWSAMGTGANSVVYALAIGPDGSLYAGGEFTSAGGVANTSRIAKWNGTAWSALGTGANGTVRTLAIGPDGSLYAGGEFTSAGGVANTSRIAKWNGTTWSALDTGINDTVNALIIGTDGNLYAGGAFTSAGGVANTSRIAKWNGTTWSALGTGANGIVYSLAIGPDGSLYAGGFFTGMSGVSNTAYIAKWNGTAWSALGTGTNGTVYAMTFGQDGSLYAGGAFTSAGGVSNTSYIAKWNGVQWESIGIINSLVRSAGLINDKQNIIFGGTFTTINGIPLPDKIVIYNRISSWRSLDIDLAGTATVYSSLQDNDGSIYIGFNTLGTAVSGIVTIPTNIGTYAYPKFIFRGGGVLWQIKNYTTGKSIDFNNLTLINETLTIDFDPGNFSMVSDVRGNLASYIVPGGSFDFFLQPGDNNISAFITGSDPNSRVAAIWKNTFRSIDGAVS
jgi:hypothetical protein